MIHLNKILDGITYQQPTFQGHSQFLFYFWRGGGIKTKPSNYSILFINDIVNFLSCSTEKKTFKQTQSCELWPDSL